MPSASYYRIEAQRCRRLAAEDHQASASGSSLRKLAEEYEQLALWLDDSDGAASGTKSPSRRGH